MKTIILSLVLLASISISNAQVDKKTEKAAKKYAKKEVKKREKVGWGCTPGKSMEDMFMSSYVYTNTLLDADDESSEDRYISGEGIGVARSKAAAQRVAFNNARTQITELLKVEIEAMTKSTMATENVNNDVNSIEETTSAVMQKSKAELTNLKPIVNIYKETPAGYESNVILYFDKMEIKKKVEEEVKARMRKKVE